MKIVIDENIAFAQEAFEPFGEVTLCHGRKIDNALLKDADALLVRSITKVGKALLENTRVSFVGTATIGSDHIDLSYLHNHSIAFTDAKGCNAFAVTEYVISVICDYVNRNHLKFSDLTLGIVGAGDIGTKVAEAGSLLGLQVLLNDPPKELSGDPRVFAPLRKVLSSSIVTIHTPLTYDGDFPTYHLLDVPEISALDANQLLINAGRGEVVNNAVLSEHLHKTPLTVALDVWEKEGEINQELLSQVACASPHVAGYSFEGKVNGTAIIYRAFAQHFNLPQQWIPPTGRRDIIDLSSANITSLEELLYTITHSIYDCSTDTAQLKKAVNLNKNEVGEYFDLLRKNYSLRKEFLNFTIVLPKSAINFAETLKGLRFTVVEG